MHLGFAMGGALAVAVVSGILADSYLNKEVLENRVACITFGQPLIANCTQQEFVEGEGLPDCGQFIQELCCWMLELVQVAMFVVDYR